MAMGIGKTTDGKPEASLGKNWVATPILPPEVDQQNVLPEASLLAAEIVMAAKQYEPASRELFLDGLIDDLSLARDNVHASLEDSKEPAVGLSSVS